MTGPEPWTDDEIETWRTWTIHDARRAEPPTAREQHEIIQRWLATLTAAREEIARLEALHHAKCLETGAEIARLRANNAELMAVLNSLSTPEHDPGCAEALATTDALLQQAEQRVLELQRDLSDTTAECELRGETIAAYWDERVKLEKRLAESQAALQRAEQVCVLFENRSAPRESGPRGLYTGRYEGEQNVATHLRNALTPKPLSTQLHEAYKAECAAGTCECPTHETPKPAAGGEGA